MPYTFTCAASTQQWKLTCFISIQNQKQLCKLTLHKLSKDDSIMVKDEASMAETSII